MNLLVETIEVLNHYNLTEKDILWVGCPDFYVGADEFLKIANTEYEEGFGFVEVAEDLLIVGKDWWLERHEHDGKEWWEFKRFPLKPKRKIKLRALTVVQAENLGFKIGCSRESLARINKIKEKE